MPNASLRIPKVGRECRRRNVIRNRQFGDNGRNRSTDDDDWPGCSEQAGMGLFWFPRAKALWHYIAATCSVVRLKADWITSCSDFRLPNNPIKI